VYAVPVLSEVELILPEGEWAYHITAGYNDYILHFQLLISMRSFLVGITSELFQRGPCTPLAQPLRHHNCNFKPPICLQNWRLVIKMFHSPETLAANNLDQNICWYLSLTSRTLIICFTVPQMTTNRLSLIIHSISIVLNLWTV